MSPIMEVSSPIRNTAAMAADVRSQTTPATTIRTTRPNRETSAPRARPRPAATPAAARVPPTATTIDWAARTRIGRKASSGKLRFNSTNRTIVSSHAAIAIARPSPGRPSGPASKPARSS